MVSWRWQIKYILTIQLRWKWGSAENVLPLYSGTQPCGKAEKPQKLHTSPLGGEKVEAKWTEDVHWWVLPHYKNTYGANTFGPPWNRLQTQRCMATSEFGRFLFKGLHAVHHGVKFHMWFHPPSSTLISFRVQYERGKGCKKLVPRKLTLLGTTIGPINRTVSCTTSSFI